MIYSFNIFETLISRTTGTPAGIFNLMQNEILKREMPLSECQTREFRNLRVYSECEAFADKRPTGITLDDIYRKLGEYLQVPAPVIAQLKALEIESEVQSAIPVTQNLQTFFDALNTGQRVILASDIYLPRFAIKEILDVINPAIYQASTLYLASETGKTKGSGELYRLIVEKEGVRFSDIFHTGGNLYSDYLMPRSLGVKAKHVEFARLRRWETLGVLAKADGCSAIGGQPPPSRRSLEPPVHFPDMASSTLNYWEMTSGLSRKARLSGATGKYLLGYSLAAPLLVSFAYWVLTEASKRKINRLYFIARDGQIFLKIAKELQKRGLAPDIDTRYLYGSRRAWHLPSFCGFDDRDLFWIIDSRRGLTLRKLATRIGLEIDEFLMVLAEDPDGKRFIKSPDRVLSRSDIGELPNILRSNARLNAMIGEVADKAKQTLIEYLEQEGWYEESVRHALVDIGWSGRSQDSLFRAINEGTSKRPLTGFYFGLHCQTDMTNELNTKLPFALNPHHFYSAPNGHQFFQIIHVLECLTAADHGGTITYERQDGIVTPRLDGQGKSVVSWGLEQYHKGILDFAREIKLGEELADAEASRLRLRDIRHYLFDEYPEPEIAEALGTYPFTPEMDGAGQAEFAPRLSFAEALRYLAITPIHRSSISSWVRGSYVRSNFMSRIILSTPSLATFTLLLHPRHTASVSIRRLVRFIPRSVRPRIRHLLPMQFLEKIEILIGRRKPSKKF